MTHREAIIKSLLQRGYLQVPHRDTSKYTVFRKPEWLDTYLFIGKNGAIRHGRISSNSVPINEVLRKKLIAAGKNLA